MPFSRRGSCISFANANGGSNEFGKAELWLANSRLRPNDRNTGNIFSSNHFRQIRLELVKDGLPRQCVISTTPYELTLRCDFGAVSFCIGDMKYARCRGLDGLTLRVTPPGGMMGPSAALDLFDGSWKVNFGNYFMLLVPMAGTFRPGPRGSLDLVPDDGGVIELVMEESVAEPKRRASYLSYEACVAVVRADFDGFVGRLAPSFPEKYRERGLQAVWTLWGLTVAPEEGTLYKRQMVKMMRSSFEGAFSWQQGMHAFFLAYDPDFAWEVLLSCFDNQDATGRIADSVTYNGAGETMKPPIQGIGLLWLMDHADISKKPREELEFLYDGLERWTNFHLNYRDLDHDGIYENHNAGETGWESCSYFRLGFPLASPDTNAYLALQEEALCRLGRLLGKTIDVCAYWENKSKETVRKIVDMFWTADGWTAVNIVTKERAGITSAIPFCTLVLGKRLPQAVIDKSISLLFDTPGFDTPFGLASENLNSPYFQHGWCGGSIATPVQALMVLALEACGRPDLARKVAREYLDTMSQYGLVHIHDPLTGRIEFGNIRFFGEEFMFSTGWAAGNYIFFAEHYGS
jgi:hypothetical protein